MNEYVERYIRIYKEGTCDNADISCDECIIDASEVCVYPRSKRIPERNKIILSYLQQNTTPEELLELLL